MHIVEVRAYCMNVNKKISLVSVFENNNVVKNKTFIAINIYITGLELCYMQLPILIGCPHVACFCSLSVSALFPVLSDFPLPGVFVTFSHKVVLLMNTKKTLVGNVSGNHPTKGQRDRADYHRGRHLRTRRTRHIRDTTGNGRLLPGHTN